jgi:hypothetical protein
MKEVLQLVSLSAGSLNCSCRGLAFWVAIRSGCDRIESTADFMRVVELAQHEKTGGASPITHPSVPLGTIILALRNVGWTSTIISTRGADSATREREDPSCTVSRVDPAFAERNCHRQLHPWRDTNHDGGVDDVSCSNLVAQEGFAPNSRSFYQKQRSSRKPTCCL